MCATRHRCVFYGKVCVRKMEFTSRRRQFALWHMAPPAYDTHTMRVNGTLSNLSVVAYHDTVCHDPYASSGVRVGNHKNQAARVVTRTVLVSDGLRTWSVTVAGGSVRTVLH